MRKETVLIGFRVSPSFRQRMEIERASRDVSMQAMIHAALTRYFAENAADTIKRITAVLDTPEGAR